MSWSKLRAAVGRCRECPLWETRNNAVFGEGPEDSPVLLVGEAPGAEEDSSGRPFVGRSGRFLTDLMAEAGLRREDLFISNVVHCRPPGNRNPKKGEIRACLHWLEDIVALLRPQVVVTVGNVPSRTIIDTKEGISTLRGRFHHGRLGGMDLTIRPIFHPAYLLRNRSREVGSPVSSTLEDLRTLVGFVKTTS
ncbi:uracil-DNA glycosylase [Dethiosulfovibrio acidaminovorans]|uniref:Type-4 uracil-DNA glycosylase n=1 Tax=Dethiosulfovibrio acidaminovorans TaxID=133535 RepID=A0ABS9EUC0_9BACT|nr:uracil-DNA glycosylase [Dethiosulfovibrio acidaminovorans]MCF4144829.1 uracil-DNA glycosylase [Dethiosulfovibrio acidaminovorans]